MDKASSESRSQPESPNNSDGEPSNKEQAINLIKHVNFIKWYSKVTIFVKNFEFNTVALFDSRADLSCIQEGLIPTKFYKKSKESLTASGKSLQLNYEIPKAHVCQNKICFKTSFVLVKNITDHEVILGLPFIALLYPFQVEYDNVTSTHLGEKVKFEFLSKPELHNLKALQKSSVSKSVQIIKQHWKHLHKFLQIVKRNGLVVSAKKINLFQTNVRFLGLNICQSHISPID
ncbi:unnamed protein product [Prunus brigantina]